MTKSVAAGLLILLIFAASGCGRSETRPRLRPKGWNEPANTAADPDDGEELSDNVKALRAHFKELSNRKEHSASEIEVQHILIGVRGGGAGNASRSLAEAERDAADLFARAKDGDDYDKMVRENSDDSPIGKYTMLNGAGANPPGKYYRSNMVPAFGNVGWKLKVGEFGVSNYDPTASPYGFHIIKRLK